MLVESEDQLRALIPAPLEKIKVKILDKLERHSRHMIEVGALGAFSCERGEDGGALTLVTARGAMSVPDERTLRIRDREGTVRKAWGLNGASSCVGGLVTVAGIQETLRVNGRAKANDDDENVDIEVHEVFLQCPKAFVRSKLWSPDTWTSWSDRPSPLANEDERSTILTKPMMDFVEASPFALVGTRGADDRGDVSPRGDPVGQFVRCLDDRTLLLPDRTGNHLVDTLRNVLHHPFATIVFLLPGSADILRVRGRTRITADETLLAPSAVKKKAPKLGILFDVLHAEPIRGALEGFWDPASLVDPKDFPTFGEMMLDQVNPGGKLLNKIGAKIFDLGSEYHKRRHLY